MDGLNVLDEGDWMLSYKFDSSVLLLVDYDAFVFICVAMCCRVVLVCISRVRGGTKALTALTLGDSGREPPPSVLNNARQNHEHHEPSVSPHMRFPTRAYIGWFGNPAILVQLSHPPPLQYRSAKASMSRNL